MHRSTSFIRNSSKNIKIPSNSKNTENQKNSLFDEKKSQNFEISETAKIFESQKKQVGELNYIQKNCFIQISCTDFWSNKTKVKFRNMGKLEPVTENKPAECEKKMSFAVPVLEDKFRRSNFMNNQIDKISRVGYAVAIDKIINECKTMRVNTKKLSYDLTINKIGTKKDLKTINRTMSLQNKNSVTCFHFS